MLAALVIANGGEPLDMGILPDDPAAFAAAAERTKTMSDVIVFMAGSSMSDRDYTAETIAALGAPGILVHGIAFRPGKPTIFAVCDGVPVFGLPGNPNSALVTARRFLGPTLWRMLGALPPPPRFVTATLAEAELSPSSLEHWIPAALVDQVWVCALSDHRMALVRTCTEFGAGQILGFATSLVRRGVGGGGV